MTALPLCLVVACLAGLAASASPARAQAITEFPLPAIGTPEQIAAGPDGALWYTDDINLTQSNIGRVTPSGAITTLVLQTRNSFPEGIAAGPDGALWFTLDQGSIARVTPAGSVTEFPLPDPAGGALGIAAGPDGALWFTEENGNRIGRITISGAITEFTVPTAAAYPQGIIAGPDGNLWFTERNAGKIGRISPAGGFAEFPIPTASAQPWSIAAGPDGALWFTEQAGDRIGRVTPAGAITEFALPHPGSGPAGITAGPDGGLWFTEGLANAIGRIGTTGTIAEYPTPTAFSGPLGIASGPDGNLWFTEKVAHAIGRLVPPPAASTIGAAVLPSSRSVGVGAAATVFATMINAGAAPASGCAIDLLSAVPAGLTYQTTDPSTNALTGTPDTPATIPAGGAQSFLIALDTKAAFLPTQIAFGFACTGAEAAASLPGVNTLLLSASATPVPDIVALAATPSQDGILDLPGAAGANAFAVATINLGAGGSIGVAFDTGNATLPVALAICQTVPATGACLAPPAASVTVAIAGHATPTFSVFAAGTGTVPFAPAANRIFVRFRDAAGAIRGATSVALRTQ